MYRFSWEKLAASLEHMEFKVSFHILVLQGRRTHRYRTTSLEVHSYNASKFKGKKPAQESESMVMLDWQDFFSLLSCEVSTVRGYRRLSCLHHPRGGPGCEATPTEEQSQIGYRHCLTDLDCRSPSRCECVSVSSTHVELASFILPSAPSVFVILWEGPAVTSRPVYAQSDWSSWQRLPSDSEATNLPTLSPWGLQRENQCEHHHVPQAR